MPSPLHILKNSSALHRRILPGAEWMAENAYIPPGAHRLLTAGGLAIGLWGGRKLMDAVTARRADGTEISREQIPEIFRPVYGLMRYNPYSDNAADRWKFVIDRTIPVLTGALGAWAGSRHYAYGKFPNGKPIFEAGAKTQENLANGNMSMQTADSNMRRLQADAIRKPASIGFAGGSGTGTQLFGALFPFNNGGMSGLSFQLLAERVVRFPFIGRRLNDLLFGNRTAGSRALRPAMADAARWAESNLLKFGDPKHWLTDQALTSRARDALQNFEKISPEQEKRVADSIRTLIEDGHKKLNGLRAAGHGADELSKHLYEHLAGTAPTAVKPNGFLGKAFDRLLHTSGIDLREANVGQSRGFSFLAKFFGSGKAEREVESKLADYLKKEFNLDYGPSRLGITRPQAAATWAGAAGVVGVGLAAGGIAADRMNQRLSRTEAQSINSADGVNEVARATQRLTQQEAEKNREAKRNGNPILTWLNDKPLDVAQWTSRVLITPPSMHRFMSAAYLSGALWLGMEAANALTGRKLPAIRSGPHVNSLLARKDIFAPLRPLHNLMPYSPGSTALSDRWRQAAHFLIPVAVGALGTFTGSHLFFKDRIQKLERPKTLEDMTDRVAMEQSKFYAGATAITSIFNTGSGVHLLPFFNYSSNLHNRYLLASGQQVAMPGIGKWWSGNPGLTPWGVKNGLEYMAQYASHNDSARPTELPSLVHAVIAKLYPHMPEDVLLARKQAVLDHLHDVRDSYLVNNKIPAEKQPQLHTAMKQLLSGEGFEKLLLESGLNPAEANLASNGVSGAIADFFNSGGKVRKLQDQYRQDFAERTANSKVSTREYLGALKSTPSLATANDNNPNSFAERVKANASAALQAKI